MVSVRAGSSRPRTSRTSRPVSAAPTPGSGRPPAGPVTTTYAVRGARASASAVESIRPTGARRVIAPLPWVSATPVGHDARRGAAYGSSRRLTVLGPTVRSWVSR